MTDIDSDPAKSAAAEGAPADTGPTAATALAEPPRPPVVPPGANATGEAPPPRRKNGALIAAIVIAAVAIALLAVVGYLVTVALSASSATRATTSPAAVAAFNSAMRKADVKAQPPTEPVAIERSVQANGSHPFSATFTPEEIAALINNFPYASSLAGVNIELAGVTLAIPEPGSVKLSAQVSVNGGTHAGTVTAPVTFANGLIMSPGATQVTVDGVPTSGAQKTQVSDALVRYFNAYLSAAPGLHIDTASVGADGITVRGIAPDTLVYP